MGSKASDVYYKNEDRRIAEANGRRGNSYNVAIQLRKDHQEKNALLKTEMAK